MVKKIFTSSAAVLLAAMTFFASSICAFAEEADGTERSYTNSSTGYEAVVYDMADLLSDTEEKALLDDMKAITTYGGAAFITTDSNYSSTSYYAESMYREYFGKGSGAVRRGLSSGRASVRVPGDRGDEGPDLGQRRDRRL